MPLLQKRTVIVPHAALYAPAPGGGGGGSLTFTVTDNNDAWQTSISPPAVFTNMAAGTASSDRVLVAIIGIDGNATNGVVSGCTIGGVAGTQRAGTPPLATGHGIYIYDAAVPTGTTATVSIACSGFPSGMAVILGAITGSATTAFSAGTQAAYNTNADPRTLSNTVPANGVGVFAYVFDRDVTPTWVNATGIGSINHAGSNACDLIAAWTTNNNPSFTNANGFGGAGAIASWGP